MATELHVFSTGFCRIGGVGVTNLTNTANGLGSVQDASLETSYQKKELMNSPQQSIFPVDVGFYGGQATAKITVNDINRTLLGYITGATKTTSGTTDTYTLGKTAQPNFFRLELDTITTTFVSGAAKNCKLVLLNCYSVSLPLAFKLDDFGSIQFDVFCLPDGSGNVWTIAMDQ